MTVGLLDAAQAVASERSREIKSQKYINDPVLWAREYLGIQLWQRQRDILESIRDNRNTAVAAGHGVGKSFCAAVAVVWWIDTHPPDSTKTFVATTAPSVDQVSILWDNIRTMYDIAKDRYERELVDHMLPGYITGDNKWKLPNGSLIGQGRKPPDNKGDIAFQGRHADYLFAIGDEAVGISKDFLDAMGNIATGQYNRQLLLANPTDPTCAMAKLWDDSITGWNRMHISVFDTPWVSGIADPLFDTSLAVGLSGWDFINAKLEEWGEDDARYIARVLGQWAFDMGNLVFSAEDLAKARSTVVRPYPDTLPRHGWDISGDGADFTVGYELLRGEVWETDPETGKPLRPTGKEGFQIRLLDKWNKTPLIGTNPSKPGTATKIHELALARGAETVNVDASGLGKGVVDGIVDIGIGNRYSLWRVYGQTPAQDTREYVNIRVETFFTLKTEMAKGLIDISPEDEILFDQLSGIQYEPADKGGLKIESKDSMRKRGVKSPDHADACWYARYDSSGLEVKPTEVRAERREQPGVDFAFNAYKTRPGMPMKFGGFGRRW